MNWYKISQIQTYRLVGDWGYGDKAWLERELVPEEAVKALNERLGFEACKTIEEALNMGHHIYTIEEEGPDDKEDWDWMDS